LIPANPAKARHAAQANPCFHHIEQLENIIEKVKALWGLTTPGENARKAHRPVPK
jgi:hypothetical protein